MTAVTRTYQEAVDSDGQQGIHIIQSAASKPVIAFTSSNYKYHRPSVHNTLKDKEKLYNGQLVSYKEADSVRTWAKIAASGDTSEKEAQGVFICNGRFFDQGDKTKVLNPEGINTWTIVTGGATINLSTLVSDDGAPLVSVDLVGSKPSTAESNNEGLLQEYNVSTSGMTSIRELEANTNLTIRNDVPNLRIPITQVLVQAAAS